MDSTILSDTASKDNNVVAITFSTPNTAVNMGIRYWLYQFHAVIWTITVPEDRIALRYTLNGKV